MGGSSPRSRGTACPAPPRLVPCRFIPAFAGNGAHRRRATRLLSVHPRVRGERFVGRVNNLNRHGSSPRSRGTELSKWRAQVMMRFIPAFAGNGCNWWQYFSRDAVHPRVRGERDAKNRVTCNVCGSSPRSRGTGGDKAVILAVSRFIPAFAGNGPIRSSHAQP